MDQKRMALRPRSRPHRNRERNGLVSLMQTVGQGFHWNAHGQTARGNHMSGRQGGVVASRHRRSTGTKSKGHIETRNSGQADLYQITLPLIQI